jgi:hypothetical protein
LTGDFANECLRALPEHETTLYAMAGSIVAWIVLRGQPWASRARRERKVGKRIFSWDFQMVIPSLVTALYVLAPAWLATVIGEPATARDAVILGLGAQGFVSAFLGREPDP